MLIVIVVLTIIIFIRQIMCVMLYILSRLLLTKLSVNNKFHLQILLAVTVVTILIGIPHLQHLNHQPRLCQHHSFRKRYSLRIEKVKATLPPPPHSPAVPRTIEPKMVHDKCPTRSLPGVVLPRRMPSSFHTCTNPTVKIELKIIFCNTAWS